LFGLEERCLSRKDLSRTVIEGGRYHHNSWLRTASHGVERARTRAWLDRVRFDPDDAEDTVPEPRSHVGRSFYDKLAPAKRWLASQVGRPWSKVYSELCAKFDTRTIAGRHVVVDHMLPWVRMTPTVDLRWGPRSEFVVDAHGILRHDPLSRHSYYRQRAELYAWIGDRRAAKTFFGWWWYRIDMRFVCSNAWCSRGHVWENGKKLHRKRWEPVAAMSRADQRRLERLPAELRRDIVVDLG
jgi:hypothetical protein